MKKITALLLIFTLLLTFAACSSNKTPDVTDAPNADTTDTPVTDAPVTDAPEAPAAESALALLESVWAKYAEDEKFAAAGGDYSEENAVSDAPGKYGLDDTDALDSVLGLPQSAVAMLDDAASLMHMMNANSFTCGAFHVADAENTDAVVTALKDNILARRWMCGFPDELRIYTVGSYVVSFFGVTDITSLFSEKLTETFPDAVLACEEPIA